MIREEDIIEIGKFQKTHALKGELNAILDVDVDYAEEGLPFIVDMDGIFVPFYAESIRTKGTDSFLVRLKDVDTQEEAQKFVNKVIYGLRGDLLEYFGADDLDDTFDFIGYTIHDEELGKIGRIEDIDDSTANVLFIVEGPDDRRIYVPVADEFIVDVDDDAKIINTRLPEGLIGLNG